MNNGRITPPIFGRGRPEAPFVAVNNHVVKFFNLETPSKNVSRETSLPKLKRSKL